MSFRELYDYSQTVAERIHRDDLKARAEQLSGVDRVAAMHSGLDPLICRGMYLSLRNTEHRFIQQHGCNVIVLARDLDRFWQRYIFVKELMHVFSDPSEATDSGEKLERLLIELSGGVQEEMSLAMKSEIDCSWMALAILCPEQKRLSYRHSHLRGEIDYYRISQELRIPEQQVYHLLHTNFDKAIARILDGG